MCVCVQNSRDNLISSTSGGSQFKSAILHQSRQLSSLLYVCLLEEKQILLNSRGTFLKYQKITNFFKASKVKNCNPLHAINAVLGIIRSKLWTSLLLYDLQQHHYCQGPSIPLYASMLYYVLYQGGLKGGPRQPKSPFLVHNQSLVQHNHNYSWRFPGTSETSSAHLWYPCFSVVVVYKARLSWGPC